MEVLLLLRLPLFISISLVVYVTSLTIIYPWPRAMRVLILLAGPLWLWAILWTGSVDTYAVVTKFMATGIRRGADSYLQSLGTLFSNGGILLRLGIYTGGLFLLTLEAMRLSRIFYLRSFPREKQFGLGLKVLYLLSTLALGLPFLGIFSVLLDRRWNFVEVVVEGAPVLKDQRMGIFIINWNLFLRSCRELLRARRLPRLPDFHLSDDLLVHRSILDTGSLAYGGPGSGKTNLIYNWMMLPAITRGERCIIYDYKGDFTAALGEDPKAIILSPFDSRGWGWAVGRDAGTTSRFLELMWALVATTGTVAKDKFFSSSFVDIATAIFIGLRERHGDSWMFRDLYRTIHSKEAIEAAIEKYRPEAGLLLSGEDQGDQTAGIMGTIREKMIHLEALARAWGDPGQPRFSLSEFLADDYGGEKTIVIIRVHPQYPRLNQDFVSMLLQLLIAQVTSLPDAVGRRDISLFLDELQTLGYIPALIELPRVGRSKGLHSCLGTQDFGRTSVLYREEGGTKGLLNSIGLKLIGHLPGDEAKADAEKMLGKVRVEKWQRQRRGPKGGAQGEEFTKVSLDQPAMVGGGFSLPEPSLASPAFFFMQYSDWPIVRLSYPIRPVPQRYPPLIEAGWILDLDMSRSSSSAAVKDAIREAPEEDARKVKKKDKGFKKV